MINKLLILISVIGLTACDQADDAAITPNDISLPPLTYTYKFDNCPFEVKFPGEPVIKTKEANLEQIELKLEGKAYFSECLDLSKLDISFNSSAGFTAFYLTSFLAEDTYTNPSFSKSKPEYLERATYQFEASIVDTLITYKTLGVTLETDNYLLLIQYATSNLELAIVEAEPIFKSVTLNSNWQPNNP